MVVAGETESLKILIADDNSSDLMILQSIVRKQGHQVITATDGIDAVELFQRESPQLVLLDALMPRMDGFEAARIIKELAGEELVPIIFLTSLTEAESLAKCLDAGGDDFLSKPYNQIILKAKIQAFNRMRVMHKTLQDQRDQIVRHNEHMLREQRVAKRVYDNVAHLGCLHARNIQHLLSPLSVFNGDVLLACQKPSGGMHVLLGDFTGHGLPAAIGAMPLAEIFYGMTAKGFSMPDVLREINQKLKKILPVGFFCCAVMVDLNFSRRDIEIWMGGMPDCLLLRRGELLTLHSNHLPLGVLASQNFRVKTYKYDLDDGDRIFLWSDGIVEARDPDGELFGEDRLRQVFTDNQDQQTLFNDVRQAVVNFMGSSERSDDLTMAEVVMMPEDALGVELTPLVNSALTGPRQWALSYRLTGTTLRDFNPIPLLLHVILEVPGLRALSGQIYTLLAELYANALEHGVLGLESALKQSPEGFVQYYAERERRLSHPGQAWIDFQISHVPEGRGGVLCVRVEDSGAGFDHGALCRDLPSLDQYSGRGIPLLRAMCRRLEFQGTGNVVVAEFAWQRS